MFSNQINVKGKFVRGEIKLNDGDKKYKLYSGLSFQLTTWDAEHLRDIANELHDVANEIDDQNKRGRK